MSCILYSSVCLLLLFKLCSSGDPCPSESIMTPCTCTQANESREMLLHNVTTPAPRPKRDVSDKLITPEITDDSSLYTTVKCLKPRSLNNLQETVSTALDRKCVDKLIVANIPPEKGDTLAKLPADWLRNVRVRHLQILNSQLYGDFLWNGSPLKDQTENLYWLTVNNCYLFGALSYDTVGTVHTRGLNTFRRLEGIDFSLNHLTAILNTAFKAPQANLTNLILGKNNIQYIDNGAFQHIPLLNHIDLSHNRLTTVLRTYFAQPAKYLEHINLSWNSISSLPINIFDNMPALKSVNMSHNFLFSLPVKPWSVVWKNLTYIDVSGNFVVCDCNLMWILPILLPPNVNSTVPRPLPGQTVIGRCSQTELKEQLQTTDHNLTSLTREKLTC